jgi:two-component system response regulator/two-component system chemotaxis response regulator CheY
MARHSVLVIDDEPQFLRLMDRALREDFTVLTAADALDGYALLCQHKPDIVLLDVMMPLLDGWTVLRKIRSNQDVSKVPVIVVTGLGPEAAEHEAGRLGVMKIFQKPVEPSQLVKAIREALAASVD